MDGLRLIIEKAGLQNCSLYGRSLERHLESCFNLAERCGLSEQERVVAGLHSLYGDLFGYNARGLEFDQRDYVRQIVGLDTERLIYLYNVAQPTGSLLEPDLFRDEKEHETLRTKEGVLRFSREEYRSIINVYAVDILEQLYYLVKEARICTFSDFKPYLQKFDAVDRWLNNIIRGLFLRAEADAAIC